MFLLSEGCGYIPHSTTWQVHHQRGTLKLCGRSKTKPKYETTLYTCNIRCQSTVEVTKSMCPQLKKRIELSLFDHAQRTIYSPQHIEILDPLLTTLGFSIQIIVNGEVISVLDYKTPDQEVELTAPEGESEIQLHILVENQGRVNYANYETSMMDSQRKGNNVTKPKFYTDSSSKPNPHLIKIFVKSTNYKGQRFLVLHRHRCLEKSYLF